MNQTVVILDFGGQYNQLIARRVRECGVLLRSIALSHAGRKNFGKKPIGYFYRWAEQRIPGKCAQMAQRSI